MSIKKLSLALVIAGVILFIFSLTSKTEVETEKQKIVVSSVFSSNFESGLLVDFAQDKGYFDDNNLEVEKLESKSSITNLIANESDVALIPLTSSLNAYINGKDTRWIGKLGNYTSSRYCVSRFPKEEFNKIKKIGTIKIGSAEHHDWILIADKIGLSKGVEYIATPGDQAKSAALEKGEIDIIFVFSPKAFKELKEKGKYYTFLPDEFFKDTKLVGISALTSKETVESKQEALKSFLAAINRVIEYTKDNKEETVEYLKSKYELTDESANLFYDGIELSRVNMSLIPNKEDINDMTAKLIEITKASDPRTNTGEFVVTDLASEVVNEYKK